MSGGRAYFTRYVIITTMKKHSRYVGTTSRAASYRAVLFMLTALALVACKPQPRSMFEQQAEAEANQAAASSAESEALAAIVAPVVTAPASETDTQINSPRRTIDVSTHQAIAKQRSCEGDQADCQYFELNVLEFEPAQPWLNSIMWQTIARVMAPETPLASQDEVAKKTVSMLFNQVAYSEQAVPTLPMYQRIDTDLILNASSDAQQQTDKADTGYLVVHATQQHGDHQRHYLSYVMLDMQKQLQLTIRDILLPNVDTEMLLDTFQHTKKKWLTEQGVAADQVKDWPLQLSSQWYLDEQGLHMVYQAGELLEVQTEAVDLMVPYGLLQPLIKPRYMITSPESAAHSGT